MANKTFQGRIVQKHDTEANWKKATNFIPLKGEIIIYDDLNKIKIGDGSTKINDLKFSTVNPSDMELVELATVATSGSYNDLSNKPTIPSVGNGTLTIQKNGTKIDTFAANATTDKTINITIPEKKDYELYFTITNNTSDNTFTIDRDVNEIFSAVKENLDVFGIWGETYYKSPRLFTPPDRTPYITFSAIDNKENLLRTFYIGKDGTIIYKTISLVECLPLTGGTMAGDIDTSNNNISNIKSLSFKDKLSETDIPLYGYVLNNTGRLEASGIRPDGDYTLIFDTYNTDEPEALIEHLRSEGESMPIITLRNIAEPLTYYDAANKKYVDDKLGSASSTTIITWVDDGT